MNIMTAPPSPQSDASRPATLAFSLSHPTPAHAAGGARGHDRCAIGEEFLYCVKAAGFADGSAASGRACGLRPVPPYAAPQQRQSAADPDRSLSVVLQAAEDEGEGVDAATFRTAPRPSALPGQRSRARTVFVGTRLWNVASRL